MRTDDAAVARKMLTAQGTVLVLVEDAQQADFLLHAMQGHPAFTIRKSACEVERHNESGKSARFIIRTIGQMPHTTRGTNLDGLILYADVVLTSQVAMALLPCFVHAEPASIDDVEREVIDNLHTNAILDGKCGTWLDYERKTWCEQEYCHDGPCKLA